nr:hypothetical protein [Tanacetum cinerariifolium]
MPMNDNPTHPKAEVVAGGLLPKPNTPFLHLLNHMHPLLVLLLSNAPYVWHGLGGGGNGGDGSWGDGGVRGDGSGGVVLVAAAGIVYREREWCGCWDVIRKNEDKRGIVIRNKARLVDQGHTQEEGIDYDEVFAPVARVEAIRLFLAYASFKDFVVYQMDVKSDFLYGKIEKEDEDGEEVDVHMYRSMIGSLMYLTSLRPDIMFVVCACAIYQVNPKILLFDLVAYTDSDYAGASLDRKSTTGGCQFLRSRLISWQYKKQTVVENSTTEAEYVAASSCCEQVLWIQNQLLDYGVNTAGSKLMLLGITYYCWVNVNAVEVLVYCHGQTINEESQIHAWVDGKKIIITESSVRRDLRLADEDGVDCLPNFTIFKNLKLIGKPKRKVTEVPQPSGLTEHVADEAVYKELDDKLVRAATTASSLEAEQDSGNIDKTQSKATPNEASSLGTTSGGGPRCQEIIRDTISQTRFENVCKLSNDSLLARGNTLQSDEDSMKINELMKLCITLQTGVLDLEKTKTTQALEIDSLKRRVKKLEKKKQRLRTHKLKRLYKVGLTARVDSSKDEQSLSEDASKQERKIHGIDADEDITLVNDQDDAKMFDVDDLHGEEVFVEKEVADKEVNDEVNDKVQKVVEEVVEDINTVKLIVDAT